MSNRTERRRVLKSARGFVWKPGEEIAGILAAVNVPTLRATLADGTLLETVTTDDIDGYCRIAAVRWSDHPDLGAASLKGSSSGAVATATLIDHLRFNIFYTLTGAMSEDGHDEMTVETPRGPLEVTRTSLRHWEWTLTILTDEQAARTLLAQAPESSRTQAEETVVLAFAQDFDETIAQVSEELGLQSPDEPES